MLIMTRAEVHKLLPNADLMIVDEIDETVLDYPYEFQDGSET
jgi:hypothetical protein